MNVVPAFVVRNLEHATEVLKHAAAVDLPMPELVEASESRVRLHMANLADLCDWSLWLEAPIATVPLSAMRKTYHTLHGQIDGRDVVLCLTTYGTSSAGVRAS